MAAGSSLGEMEISHSSHQPPGAAEIPGSAQSKAVRRKEFMAVDSLGD